MSRKNEEVTESAGKPTETKFTVPKRSQGTDNKSVVIGLSTFDKPGTSGTQATKNARKSGKDKSTTVQHESTQMRESLSAVRLHGHEDIDDGVTDCYDNRSLGRWKNYSAMSIVFQSSLAEEERRPKYVLVGWDNFRSRMMLLLLILFVLWAAIYFPLIGT